MEHLDVFVARGVVIPGVSPSLVSVRAISHPLPSLREGTSPVAGQQDAAPAWLSLQKDLIAQQHQINAALQGLIEERRVLGFRFHEVLGDGGGGFGVEEGEVGVSAFMGWRPFPGARGGGFWPPGANAWLRRRASVVHVPRKRRSLLGR